MIEHIPQIGEVIGRYRILEVIGRGATGPVYRAWDETLAREVALKTLWPQFQSDERVRSRFEREARAIAKLESPHIVRVYDVGEIDNAPFIAMEYIRGGEVTSPLDSRRAAEVVRDVAIALERAHENGIIHRDIKPANVMIGTDGRAKLADFGLARAIADEATLMTNTGTLLGTPAFLAPEIIEGHEATPLSDIYSLGILLYRLVAGRAPFEESSPAAVLRAHLKGDIPRIPNASGPLNDVIAGCTALKPENRYPTATFVREDLDSVLAGRPIAGPPRDQTRIDFAVPFWARFIPGAQKTLIDLSDAVRQTESKSATRRRSLEEAHAIAQDLESRKAESERHASGWRSVAERLLAEGKENEVREALESAQAFDAEAEKYAQELETQNEFVRRVERDLRACEADTESARSQAALLRSRRHRATFGMIARRRPVSAIAAGIAILVAGITIFALAAPKKAAEPAPQPSPTVRGEARFSYEEISVANDIVGSAVAAGDIDGDGDDDLIIFSTNGIHPYVALNHGNGTFSRGRDLFPDAIGSNAISRIILEDVDDDGDLDALVLSSREPETSNHFDRLYFNDGTGNFTNVSATHLPAVGTMAMDAVFFDADGDGYRDLMITCGAAVPSVYASNKLYLNDGKGRFIDVSNEKIPTHPSMHMGFAAGDIDGDGDIDVVIGVRFGATIVWINDGKGNFVDESNLRISQEAIDAHDNLVLFDFDGNGNLDLLIPVVPIHGQPTPSVLFINDGTGHFRKGIPQPQDLINCAGSKAVADITGDGLPDVLLPNGAGPAAVYSDVRGVLKNIMADYFPSHATDEFAAGIAAFDANGDSLLDVIIMRGGALPPRLFLGRETGHRIATPALPPVIANNLYTELQFSKANTAADGDFRGNSVIWNDGSLYQMLFNTPHLPGQAFHVGYATSSDGLNWTEAPELLISTDDWRTPRILPGTDLSLASKWNGVEWLIHGIRGIPTRWVDLGPVFHRPKKTPGGFNPGSIVKHGSRFILYGDGGERDLMNGRGYIFRSESSDGLSWTQPKIIVTSDDRGSSSGHAICPSVYYDADREEWTLWYVTSDGISGDERLYLCRAKSSDGVNFHSHELFLTPETLKRSDFKRLGSPSQVKTPNGSYLYLTAEGIAGSRGTHILRLNIKDPHIAPPPG